MYNYYLIYLKCNYNYYVIFKTYSIYLEMKIVYGYTIIKITDIILFGEII